MGHGEMVCSHFSLKQVGLWYHAIDVNIHDRFGKFLIVQISSLRILLEKSSQLEIFEITSKLV